MYLMPRAQLTTDELDSMRTRLCAAAFELYREEGLEALTFRRLAESAGISHTLPYRYFENKDAMLAYMRTDGMQRFERSVRLAEQAASTLLERVRAVALAYVAFAQSYPADYQLIFASHQPSPERYPALLSARRSLFDHTVDLVQQCIDQGELEGGARELAHTCWISLHGLMMLHTASQLVHGYDLDALVEPLIDHILSAATPRRRALAVVPRPARAAMKPGSGTISGTRSRR
jgi:AcrR family transcriptional regulator